MNQGIASPSIAETNRKPHSQDDLINILMACAFIGDMILIALGFLIGFWMRFYSNIKSLPGLYQSDGIFTISDYVANLSFGFGIMFVFMLANGVYHKDSILRYKYVSLRILKVTFCAFTSLLCLSLIFKMEPSISRGFVFFSYLIVTFFLIGWRYTVIRILRMDFVISRICQRVVIVGWNDDMEDMLKNQSAPYEIIGYVSSLGQQLDVRELDGAAILGDYENLEEILVEQHAEVLVYADKDSSAEEVIHVANLCEKALVEFKVVPSFSRIMMSGLRLESVGQVLVLRPKVMPMDYVVNRFIKRSVDVIGGIIGLLVFAPLIAAFALIVYVESPGSVIYRQTRMGRRGRIFSILKIRSMKIDAEQDGKAGWTTSDDHRCLKIGRIIRKWNIDELPQFWNVVKGEMSLVGPRPERPEHIENFKYEIPRYNARHAIKPGLTGLAQVSGFRGDTNLKQRILYDLEYLENWSLFMDFHIMIRTLFTFRNAC